MQLPPDNDAYPLYEPQVMTVILQVKVRFPRKGASSIHEENRLFGDSGVKQIPAQSHDVRPRTTSIDIVFIAEMGDDLIQRETFL